MDDKLNKVILQKSRSFKFKIEEIVSVRNLYTGNEDCIRVIEGYVHFNQDGSTEYIDLFPVRYQLPLSKCNMIKDETKILVKDSVFMRLIGKLFKFGSSTKTE